MPAPTDGQQIKYAGLCTVVTASTATAGTHVLLVTAVGVKDELILADELRVFGGGVKLLGPLTITLTQQNNRELTLSEAPPTPGKTAVLLNGAQTFLVPAIQVSGTTLSWADDTPLYEDDIISVLIS